MTIINIDKRLLHYLFTIVAASGAPCTVLFPVALSSQHPCLNTNSLQRISIVSSTETG